MTFGWPIALAGLVLLPLLVLLYSWSERRRRRSQAAFGNPDLLPNVVDREPGRLRYLPVAILLVGLAAMIVGVARPHATVSVPREEATVILAMDVSRSMKAKDVEPTRLEAARAAAEGFLVQVPEKFRVGVVSFATRAAVGVPPTHDRALVEAALDSLAPGEGTAIGDAVALSVRVGQPKQPEGEEGAGGEDEEVVVPPRAIVLISDGAQDGGSIEPAKAAEEAKEQRDPGIHCPGRDACGRRRGEADRRLRANHPRSAQSGDAADARRGNGRRVLHCARRRAPARGVRGARIAPR